MPGPVPPPPPSHFEVHSDSGAGRAPGNPRLALPTPPSRGGGNILSCQGLGAQPELQPSRRRPEAFLPKLVSSTEGELMSVRFKTKGQAVQGRHLCP